MTNYRFIWIFICPPICSLLIAFEVFAAPHGVNERTFNMSVREAEEVVVDWFQNNGFNIFHQSHSTRLVDLLAETKHQRIRVTVQQHSPLAARVTISPQQGETHEAVTRLWQRLEGYIQPPNNALHPLMSAIPNPVRSLHRAVVCVYAIGKNREIQLTGFVVDSRGLVVCTGHDLNNAQTVTLLFSDGREIEGIVVKIDPLRDLALLQASAELDSVVSLRNGRFMLSNGDRLFAIACPYGGMANIEQGYLDGPPRRVAGMPLWQVQMHIDPGSSGSPVFDGQGRLVAIVKGRFRGTDSIGFLIPFETLLHFLEKY